MKPDLFREHQAELLRLCDEVSPTAAIEKAESLDNLTEEQRGRVHFMRAQFLLEIPERLNEAKAELKQSIKSLRKQYVAGHPDRDQVEMVARSVFGPKGKANSSELKDAWATFNQAGELHNSGDNDKAKKLLASINEIKNPPLQGFLQMALVAIEGEQPQLALTHARKAADKVAELERGHWARVAVEKSVLAKVALVRGALYKDDLRGVLNAAIEAINAGEKDSLKTWEAAVKKTRADGSEEAVEEVLRIDRLLRGFCGPLALLVAFEKMKDAESKGEEAVIAATEEAYFIAYEHDAHQTVSQLEAFLESVGRF